MKPIAPPTEATPLPHKRPALRGTRLLLLAGIVLSFWIALANSRDQIDATPAFVAQEMSLHEDFSNLYHAAAAAHWSDAPRWFVGSWIYPGVGYYRPLTSLLFLAEQRAFDQDFSAYNRVTWILHGTNAVLLFLLVVSLFRRYPRARVLFGLVAVACSMTPYASYFNSIQFSLHWWPAQNDILSLTFGLLALLLLDQALQSPFTSRMRRVFYAGSLVAYACAVGTKEMGYVVAPFALFWLWQRSENRKQAIRGSIPFMLMAVGFWILRRLVVPNPWAQKMFAVRYLGKVAVDWAAPVYLPIKNENVWTLAVALLLLAIPALGIRYRWSFPLTLLGGIVAVLLATQVGGGTFALLFEGAGWSLVLSSFFYLLALALFWRYRRTDFGLLAAGMLAVSFVPILQFAGHHYFYWANACLGLADGVFFAHLWHGGQEWFAAWRNSKMSANVIPAERTLDSHENV